jgi:hypothetical protein
VSDLSDPLRSISSASTPELKLFPGMVGAESLENQARSLACKAAATPIGVAENVAHPPHLSEIRILDSQVCRALADFGWYGLG